MTHQDILKELKAKKYRPIYFLHGTETYFTNLITNYIENNVLNESEKAFNQTIFYGKDVNHLAIIDTARRFPMMAPYQVVILKEAQEMKSFKELQNYFEKPANTTILVIAYKHKKMNLNTSFGKVVKKNAQVFESKSLYDNQMPDWIQTYLASKKLKVTPEASVLIGEYLGTNLSKVTNELDKLAINLAPGTTVSEQHIEENIGISKDYNVFELQKALATKDLVKANRIVQYFIANPRKNPLPMVLGAMYNYFSKVYMLHSLKNVPESELLSALKLRSAYFLKEYRMAAKSFPGSKIIKILDLLKEFDMKSKGVGYINTGKVEGELLKELVWKILH